MAKYPGWKNFPTIQFKEIISELMDAKDEQKALMIIADTGFGKTNAIKAFMAKRDYSKHTYVITLGDSYGLMVLLNQILYKLGLPVINRPNGKHIALIDIAERLNELADEGENPLFVLDEAENCRTPVLKMIKELYDAVVGKCGIVLIGTSQLVRQLNKKFSNQSVPQLQRRFKAGTRHITPFRKEKDMKPFFEEYIPGNHDLQDLLIELCNNYGELHDYLDSFLIHCEKKNKAVTEENFRLYHKIPKP